MNLKAAAMKMVDPPPRPRLLVFEKLTLAQAPEYLRSTLQSPVPLTLDGAALEWMPRRIVQLWPIVLVAAIGVIGGTWLGTHLLDRIAERIFKRLVSLLVLGLGVFMLFHSGQG